MAGDIDQSLTRLVVADASKKRYRSAASGGRNCLVQPFAAGELIK
jgi:hypothetical protein